MHKIFVELSENNFEYDIYSLVRAFYPGSEVKVYLAGEEPEGEYTLLLKVDYRPDQIFLEVWKDGEQLQVGFGDADCAGNREEAKNCLKRLIYHALCSVTGRTLPWGNLTGIRPTKIPMKLLEEGWKNVEIARYLQDTYEVSPKKGARWRSQLPTGKRTFWNSLIIRGVTVCMWESRSVRRSVCTVLSVLIPWSGGDIWWRITWKLCAGSFPLSEHR